MRTSVWQRVSTFAYLYLEDEYVEDDMRRMMRNNMRMMSMRMILMMGPMRYMSLMLMVKIREFVLLICNMGDWHMNTEAPGRVPPPSCVALGPLALTFGSRL